MYRRLGRVLLVLSGLCGSLIAVEGAYAQADASYEGQTGPDAWGSLDPSYAECKSGQRESPVNITGAVKADLSPIKFDYKLTPLKIINTGHTIQVNYGSGSSITVDGVVYDLVQFHFHHPGENAIDGQRGDLELHLVHRNAQGQLAVVAILLKSGSEDFPLHVLWNYLPKDVGKEAEHKKVELNAEDFLPNDRNFYKFSGSLTTPPCSEGVTWLVMKQFVEVSPAQIAAFAKLFPNDARPLQALNGRSIEESHFEKSSAQ